ncbi:inositol monophosphatase family protein [Tropicimonas sp. IMCC34043]|uniref:inositol monophosphatase family protein n=1 Tax=Tropicimonas sp. IMCC34043 TaxID=2248760 RepID=UPI000E27C8CB|nr:inositol monophosphatase [Tropicimonas sp. IMCC34043]
MIPDETQEAALIDAVRAAARREILPRFRNLEAGAISSKSAVDDLVTVADRASEAAISAAVAQILPGAAIVGEEAVAADATILDRIAASETTVIIDPIDGTWNYAMGLSTFGVLLAVTDRGETVFGLLYDPVVDDWVMTRRGGGTWYCTSGGQRRQLRVADAGAETSFPGFSSPWLLPPAKRERFQLELLPFGRVADLRCACHAYRQMAFGHGRFSTDFKLMPWDHAAGVLACQEAGCAVGLLDGRDYAPTIHEGYLITARDAATLAELRAQFAWLLD